MGSVPFRDDTMKLGAQVMHVGYLQRFVKPRFVNGVLKTNLVLATGIALPQLINGTFDGKAFAISLGSLGLSSAAVEAGAQGIRWLLNLRRAGRRMAEKNRTGRGPYW